MSTRCLTIVKTGDIRSEDIAVLYRQMDGYPEGHGKDLFNAFGEHKICNGYTTQTSANYANGMGCLFAQIVAHFKTSIGQFYICPAGTKNMWENFVYTLYQDTEGNLRMKVETVKLFGETRELITIFDDVISAYYMFLQTPVEEK